MLARSTLTGSRLPAMYTKGKEKIVDLLSDYDSVSLTADIWSDHTMRSFLGVTVHIMGKNPKTGDFGLLSILLTCRRFMGSHTGERIAREYDQILEDFNIETKVGSCVFEKILPLPH